MLASVPGVVSEAIAAQETVISARLTADLTGADGSATVRVEYEVAGASHGSTLPASVLAFGSAAIEGLRAGRASVPVALRDEPGVAQGAELTVETADRPGVTLVVATYRVVAAVTAEGNGLRGRIPVLTLARPPSEPGPGLFAARLLMPAGWRVTEGFPTGLAYVAGDGMHEVQLSVVPAVVGFRARTDDAWAPGLPVVLDTVAGSILVLFLLLGWRHLRRATP